MGNEKLEKLKIENGWTGLNKEKKEILKSFMGKAPKFPIDLNSVREWEKYEHEEVNVRDDFETITWQDKDEVFSIHNVPIILINRFGHVEECRSAHVQLNISMIAEDMRIGKLPNSVEYEERF